ncbi:MAG: response regulator [bacterium]
MPAASLASNGTGKILVVDDDVINRKLLRDILEACGYQVTLAEDGMQALETALDNPQDVILLDVMMPRMNGYEVCAQLRKDSRTAHLPVLMITALNGRNDRLKGIQAGATDFITKPIDAEDIRLRVKNAVFGKHLYDKVQEDYARLGKLEFLRDNLTQMIVHDIRSPLMVLSGVLDRLALETDNLSQIQRRDIAHGQSSCRELSEMVNSMLDVSRLEAGKMPISRMACDIREIARLAAESLVAMAREKTVALSVTGDPVSADVDKDIIRRVFINLIVNAINFSSPGGPIIIGVSSAGTAVRVTVTDQGSGIPPEYHQRIFEKFGRVASCEENQSYSTGLGLTFCKLAVEAHGGQISVVSEPGKGAVFTFDLPVSITPLPAEPRQPEESCPPLPTPPPPPTPPPRSARILVIDDEKWLRDNLQTILNRCGYSVETAADGREGVEMYKQAMVGGSPFDLVIMDLIIPGGIDGKQAIKELLAIDPDVRAILASGSADAVLMASQAKYGIKGVIVKPYTAKPLLALLDKVLRS